MSKTVQIRAIPLLKETLSLSKNEATVLLPVIRGGNMTVGAIATAVNLPMSKVSTALKSLIKRGLVEEIDGILPLYQANPPILPMVDTLEGFVSDTEKVMTKTTATVQKLQESIEKTVGGVTKTNEERFNALNEAFEEYETEVASKVQSHVATMTGIASDVLAQYSQKIQGVLESLNVSVEDSIGERLTVLQKELDDSQKQLAKDTKRILGDFENWLLHEKASAVSSVTDARERSQKLLDATKSVLEESLRSSENALLDSIDNISTLLGTKALEVSNQISEMLSELAESLKQKSLNFVTTASQNLLAARKSISDTAAEARDSTESQAESTQKRFDDAVASTEAFTEAIALWKEEVTNYMNSASGSVLAQLEQLSSSEKAFLEVIRSSLTGHLEKTSASIGEEYKAVRSLARNLTADTDSLMSEARASVLELLQNEVLENKNRLQKANEMLFNDISVWNEKTTKAIDKKIMSTVKEITNVLDTETSELNALTDNISSRLKSSISSIVTTTETKNEAVLSDIRRIANAYESGIEKKLREISNRHVTAIQEQVQDAKTLYESLNKRLNERLSESIAVLNSKIARAQKEIDSSIVEQVERIETHANDMRADFHARVEEITQQFISVTQTIESTFNGLIASQVVEAKDLIASAHTEFKTSMKSEMESLDSDSIKLQQEFASEIGMRIDTVTESSTSLKRTLDDFISEKKVEISKHMEVALSEIETSLSGAQESLANIEGITIKQFTDDVRRLSHEFSTSVTGARDNISERLRVLSRETADILAKNAANVKTTVDAYLSEETESMQRVLGETSTKLDRLAAANIRKTTEQVEAFYEKIESTQTTTLAERVKAKDELMSIMEERRKENILAFDAALVWIDSATDNVSTTLETLGSKLSSEVIHLQQGLRKSADGALNVFRERAQSQVSQLEEIGNSLIEHIEKTLQSTSTDLSESSVATVNGAIDSLETLPDRVKQEIHQIGNDALAESKSQLQKVEASWNDKLLALETSTSATFDEVDTLLERVNEKVTMEQTRVVEQIQQAAIISNQHATRRFESVGIDLKAVLSSSTFELIENMSSDVNVSTSLLQEQQSTCFEDITAATGALRQTRAEMLKAITNETNESLGSWANQARDSNMKLRSIIQDMNAAVIEAARITARMLMAISNSSKEIQHLPSENTWYLTGKDEVCAHIHDMSMRATKSILISTPDLDCLDLKKLAKVKTPIRRIIVIPQSEERNPDLDLLNGWRIWELPDPVLLALADDTEILIGGQSSLDAPLCIVSRNESYLRLFKEVIGPKIVAEAQK